MLYSRPYAPADKHDTLAEYLTLGVIAAVFLAIGLVIGAVFL